MQVDFGEAVATIGGGRRQGALPGRYVPALEHALRGRDAGRERGMRVRGPSPDLRPHRHAPACWCDKSLSSCLCLGCVL